MFVVEPSPKLQKRFVIVPVELSVKVTVSGFKPLVGLPTKLALGTTAPVPVTWFVLAPPSLEKTATLLNAPSLEGVKRIAMLVDPKPPMVNVAGETNVKGPELMVTVPLVNAADPEFVSVKLA